MTKRKLEYLVGTLVAIAVVAAFVIPAVHSRASWYYLAGRYDARNLLVTCEAETPIFRATGINSGVAPSTPILASLEVYLACRTRDRLLERGVFSETGLFGQNRALTDVVEQAASCLSSRDLPDDLVAHCRSAHYNAIDWLLARGADINAGELGTILHAAIHSSDDEMFAFLLSRGADPHYRSPAASVPGVAGDRLGDLVDTEPKSAAELLELQLAHIDEAEFPEIAAALRRMRAAVAD